MSSSGLQENKLWTLIRREIEQKSYKVKIYLKEIHWMTMYHKVNRLLGYTMYMIIKTLTLLKERVTLKKLIIFSIHIDPLTRVSFFVTTRITLNYSTRRPFFRNKESIKEIQKTCCEQFNIQSGTC